VTARNFIDSAFDRFTVPVIEVCAGAKEIVLAEPITEQALGYAGELIAPFDFTSRTAVSGVELVAVTGQILVADPVT
tara:strand:+ start:403 stop:633 length:231 start_codon:yes stop_codon:yes gene_type:complete